MAERTYGENKQHFTKVWRHAQHHAGHQHQGECMVDGSTTIAAGTVQGTPATWTNVGAATTPALPSCPLLELG